MRRLPVIALLVIISGGYVGHPAPTHDDPTDTVVASIDGRPLTAGEFKERYIEYLLRTGTHDEARLRKALLAQMINDRLLVADAVAAGIESSGDYLRHRATAEDKLAIELYLERAVLGSVDASQGDVEEAFVRINTTLTARHLFARTESDAEILYERILSGESFELLAREVFADPALAENGGSLGSFTFDEMDPDFEDAAYGLAVGEISRPVRTANGYSIIQVTDRFTKPILTEMDFAAQKTSIERLVIRKKRAQAQTHLIRALAEEAAINFHEPAFGRLLGQITGTSMIESLEEFLAMPLVSFAGGAWTVEDFRLRADQTDLRRRAAVRSAVDLKEFVSGLVVREVLLARSRALRTEPEYITALDRVMAEWVLASKKAELAGAAEISDEDVLRHFEEHSADYADENGTDLTFAQAAPRIREELLYIKTKERALQHVEELRSAYEIKVFDDVLLGIPIAGRSTTP